MRRFVEGIDRGQVTLFPECLGDWIDEDNPGDRCFCRQPLLIESGVRWSGPCGDGPTFLSSWGPAEALVALAVVGIHRARRQRAAAFAMTFALVGIAIVIFGTTVVIACE
jgi:hypothetical protein